MIKKLSRKKHKQHLFYIYLDTETGRIGNLCQVCEDEEMKRLRDIELLQERETKATVMK